VLCCKWWVDADHLLFPVHDTTKILFYQGPWIMTEFTCQSLSVVIGMVAGTLYDDDTGTKYVLMFSLLFMNSFTVLFMLFYKNPCNIERINIVMLAAKSLDVWSCFIGIFAIASPDSWVVALLWLVGTIAWAVFQYFYMKKSAVSLLKSHESQITAVCGFCCCSEVQLQDEDEDNGDGEDAEYAWFEVCDNVQVARERVAQAQDLQDKAVGVKDQVQGLVGTLMPTETASATPSSSNALQIDMDEKEVDEMITSYFHRYDLDGSATLATDELHQLTINLSFKLHIPKSPEEIERITSAADEEIDENTWTLDHFREWFKDEFVYLK